MSEWTNDETFKFIELYQNEPTIWNPKDKYHKDKVEVRDAWKRISDEMSIPVQELKRRKESLMAAFRLNHKKVQASIMSGAEEDDIFKPVWIYYDVMAAFMSDVYVCKSIYMEEEESVNEDPNDDKNLVYAIERPVQFPAQKRRNKPVELGETEANSDQLTQRSLNNAISALNKTLTKQNEREDDCDLYGRLLAYKLKSFTAIERQEIMYEIDGLLLKKRKRKITSESP